MAGRGTDILLGGNPAGLASEASTSAASTRPRWTRRPTPRRSPRPRPSPRPGTNEVVEAGGLHIIGTERHDSRRIDNQLRGRAGRQGDPGSSRFYLSLEDDLMKRFASERVTGLMERLGPRRRRGHRVAAGLARRSSRAQSRVEGFNFDIRKRVVEYDDVINKQRETIYAERDKVLHNEDLTETVRAFLDDEVETLVDTHLVGDDPEEWDIDGLANALEAMGLTGEGTTCRRALGAGHARGDRGAPAGPRRCPTGRPGSRGRRRRLGDGRAAGPAAHDRLAVGRAPDRARRHAPRHRPARLRPAGPAQRVPARGVRAVRGAARPDPPRCGRARSSASP